MRDIHRNEASGGRRTVLVAHGDPVRRRALVEALQEACQVDAVADGPTAMARVTAGRPQVLVIEADLTGLDGYTVTRWAARERPRRDCVVVFIARRREPGDAHTAHAAIDAGAAAVLFEPFEREELLSRVAALLG